MLSGVRRIDRPLARPANDNTIVGRFGVNGEWHAILMIVDGVALAACGRTSRAVYQLRPNTASCRHCLAAIVRGRG